MYIGAIDIGGSKTIAGIVNENGELLIEKQIVTEKSDCAAHFNRCAALLLEAAAEYGVPAQALEGVGVSLPGMVDHSHSVLLLAPGAVAGLPRGRIPAGGAGHPARSGAKTTSTTVPAPSSGSPARPKTSSGSPSAPGSAARLSRTGGCCWAATASPGSSGTARSSSSTPSPVPAVAAAASRRTPRAPPLSRRFALLLAEDPQAAALARERGASPDAAGCAAARAGRVFARAALFDRAAATSDRRSPPS